MRAPISSAISRVSTAAPCGDGTRTGDRAGRDRLRPLRPCPDIAACRRASPSGPIARWTWPSEAAAAGARSNSAKRAASRGRARPACAAHEGRAHRRGLRLQLHQFVGIFGGQRLGDRRHHLGDLHQRPLQRAERARERCALAAAPAHERFGAIRAAKRAGVDAETGVAPRARGETIGFVVLSHGCLPVLVKCARL